MNVQRLALPRKIRKHGVARLAGLGIVNRGAIAIHPLPHRAQDAHRLFRNRAVGFRPDVQQVVAAAVRAGAEVPDHRLGALPVVVGALITPTVVHGHAGFPGPAALLRVYVLFGRREIAWQSVPVVHHDVRLQLEHHLVHPLRLPALRVQRPGDVVPQHVDLPVVSQ